MITTSIYLSMGVIAPAILYLGATLLSAVIPSFVFSIFGLDFVPMFWITLLFSQWFHITDRASIFLIEIQVKGGMLDDEESAFLLLHALSTRDFIAEILAVISMFMLALGIVAKPNENHNDVSPTPAITSISSSAAALAPFARAGTPLLIEYNAAELLILPYRLGTTPRTGKLLLRAWEETKAGQPTNAFRTYEVAKITRAQTLPGHAPIELPPQAYAPDKTIPSPIAQRNSLKEQNP